MNQAEKFCKSTTLSQRNPKITSIPGKGTIAVRTIGKNMSPEIILVNEECLRAYFAENDLTFPKVSKGMEIDFPPFFCKAMIELIEGEKNKKNFRKLGALLNLAHKLGFKTSSRKKRKVATKITKPRATNPPIALAVLNIEKRVQEIPECSTLYVDAYFPKMNRAWRKKFGQDIELSKLIANHQMAKTSATAN